MGGDIQRSHTIYYCPRCCTFKPFLHKHDAPPIVLFHLVGNTISRLRPWKNRTVRVLRGTR